MDKNASVPEDPAAALLPDQISRRLSETYLERLKDAKFSEKVMRYENWQLRLHADYLSSELAKSQKALKEALQNAPQPKSAPTFSEKLRAGVLRSREKLSGSGLRGGYRKWRLWNRAGKDLIFSGDFFRFLALQKTMEKLTVTEDTGLRLPAGVPLTSILVSASGSGEQTVRFLETLFQGAPGIPFEVIVLGTSEPKAFAPLAGLYPGVRFISAPDRKKILETAGGEYLFFADDSMILLPGALEEMAAALFRHPGSGVIGGSVFHAFTGELLESGTLVCRDGRFLCEGTGEDPEEESLSFFRETDLFLYSGIITSRERFEGCGADDTATPAGRAAYAARVRNSGFVNRIMPLARLLHTGEIPEQLFEDETLRQSVEPLMAGALYDTPEERCEKRKFAKPAVLYIDAEIPRADRGSGGMDVIFFVEYMLKRGYHVTFFGENNPCFVPKYTPVLRRLGVECFCRSRGELDGYMSLYGKNFSVAFLSRVYQAQNFDFAVRRFMPQAVIIFNTVDVHFVRERLEAELNDSAEGRLKAMLTEQLELTVMSRSDSVIVISSDEKEMLQNQYGMDNCRHIPQAREIHGCKAPAAERSGMVFIGSAHPPNLDGLKYYVEEILPLLKEKNPGKDLTLTVIGEALRDEIMEREDMAVVANAPELRFAGFVEELGDHLDHARLTIAPLRYGAGTKGKVASSMSYGVPCVSSAFGTEGTGMIHNENILVAHTPEEFADAVTQLLNDDTLWQKLSEGGLKFLEENYATAAVEEKMDALWEEAANYRKLQEEIWRNCTFEDWKELCAAPPREPELLRALRTILRYNNAAIFCETPDGTPPAGEEFHSPRMKYGSTVLLEKENFDFIVLSEAPGGDGFSQQRLFHAALLAHDGARLIMPLPRRGAEELYSFLQQELKFHRIFYSPYCNCLCLSKLIPSQTGWE